MPPPLAVIFLANAVQTQLSNVAILKMDVLSGPAIMWVRQTCVEKSKLIQAL